MQSVLDAIAEPYGFSPRASLTPLGEGHINRTWLLRDDDRSVVVQQLNTQIFVDTRALTDNALAVEQHLLEKRRRGDYPLAVLRHLPCHRGRYLHGPAQDIRVLNYFSGSESIQVLATTNQAEVAAGAFAGFAAALSDLDVAAFNTVLPGFLDLQQRFWQFEAACRGDTADRLAQCRPAVGFCQDQLPLLEAWRARVPELPVRICHNDCKVNNLLFDSGTGAPLAVVDLDTCWAGHLMTEFGDLVRTCCSPEAEDSIQLARVTVRDDIFAALARGYCAGMAGTITRAERQSLMLGAEVCCFMQGMRFLTDHLNGDSYFGARHPGHNLERAENQFQLYRSLVAKRDALVRHLE